MEDSLPKRGSGLILGKFLPPHLGHQYLVDFARAYVDRLTVVVGTLQSEPIDGSLRHRWMCEICPGATVIHLTDENPQQPEDHPDFWRIWQESLLRVVPERPDYLFASEPYGFRLAEVLGARYVPVDHARALVPVSSSAIRQDPMAYFDYLPAPVRPYFVRRICIVGPESTGKTVLARRLAEAYRTTWVAEYARPLLELKDNRCDPEDIERIARGHLASEAALARQANRVIFCDTDLMTTTFWSDLLFGSCPGWIRREARRQRYCLTLLTDADAPWVDDPQRYFPERRAEFFERCRRELEALGRRYTVIGGSWDERYAAACRAVDAVIAGEESLAGG
ncbi:MAG: AAA family ATPase [Bradymonadales bacterium]|nr:AAA family ATPase [Bradymonadales bacterium]